MRPPEQQSHRRRAARSIAVFAVLAALVWAASLVAARPRIHAATFATRSADSASAGARRVVGYYPMWSYDVGYSVQAIDFGAVTHVVHSCVTPNGDGSVAPPVKSWRFPDPELVKGVHAAGARVLLGVCGDFPATSFAQATAAPETLRLLTRNLVTLVRANGYDGIDIDWEYPNSASARADLSAFVAALRNALPPGATISIALPPGPGWGVWYDIGALLPNLDWVGVMTYGLHDPTWSDTVGQSAPLFAAPGDDAGSVDSARRYWQGRGVPPDRLLIGLPFFGERFDGATQLGQPVPRPSSGPIDYRAIAPLVGNGWNRSFDALAQVPDLTRADGGVISYDDAAAIEAKCRYAIAQGLGGAIVFHLGQDAAGTDGVHPPQPLLLAARACR